MLFYQFFAVNIYRFDFEYYEITYFFFIGILPILFLIFYWHFIVPFTIYLPENCTIGKDYNNAIRLHKGDNIGLSLLIMVGIMVIYFLFHYLGALLLGAYDWQFENIFDEYNPLSPLTLGWFNLILILIPGIWEEVAFRGAVFSIFTERKNITLAIALNGLFFGLAHYMNYLTNPFADFGYVTVQVIYAGCLGLSLACLAYKMDTIIPCIIIHYVFNCFGTIFVTSFPNDLNFALFGILFVGVIPTVIVICSLHFVNREKPMLLYSKK